MVTATKTRKDHHGRTEVWVHAGELGYVLAGRVLPKNCGTWAAARVGEDVEYFDTLAQAVEALS